MIGFQEYCDMLGLREIGRREYRRLVAETNRKIGDDVVKTIRSRYPGVAEVPQEMMNMVAFDIRAPDYDRKMSYMKNLSESYIITNISNSIVKNLDAGSGNVYEFGCGTGSNICALAADNPGFDFYGFDISAQMLKVANEKKARLGLKNLEFLNSSNRLNQMRDSSAVLSIVARAATFDGLVQEMYRVTSEGGFVAIIQSVSKNHRNRIYGVKDEDAFSTKFSRMGLDSGGMCLVQKSYRQKGGERYLMTGLIRKPS